jgi:hypothetical protein
MEHTLAMRVLDRVGHLKQHLGGLQSG